MRDDAVFLLRATGKVPTLCYGKRQAEIRFDCHKNFRRAAIPRNFVCLCRISQKGDLGDTNMSWMGTASVGIYTKGQPAAPSKVQEKHFHIKYDYTDHFDEEKLKPGVVLSPIKAQKNQSCRGPITQGLN